MTGKIRLRPATIEDADILLQWRNDLQTRRASFNTEEVTKEEHVSWLTKLLENPDRLLFIAEEDGVPVGTVRADLIDGAYELSWTVAPSSRGHGVGKTMVALAADLIASPILARIKAENKASARIAEFAGMKHDREVNGVLYYRRGALKKK